VEFWEGEVTDVARDSATMFRVMLDDDRSELTRKTLIATGNVGFMSFRSSRSRIRLVVAVIAYEVGHLLYRRQIVR
ncbi:MAG: hypothetical protein ACREYC_26590, partial [Gammaproteobacteria bacterium]